MSLYGAIRMDIKFILRAMMRDHDNEIQIRIRDLHSLLCSKYGFAESKVIRDNLYRALSSLGIGTSDCERWYHFLDRSNTGATAFIRYNPLRCGVCAKRVECLTKSQPAWRARLNDEEESD